MAGSIIFSGFDSAWTPGNRGAIAHARMTDGVLTFIPPQTVNFTEASASIEEHSKGTDAQIIGIDQPLIVPNLMGSRPVEAAFRPLVGSLRGAIQPSNRGRIDMFGDQAPIWEFLCSLRASLDPATAIRAASGRHAFEIYPAAALIGLFPLFRNRRRAAKYNPGRLKTFSLEDWRLVSSLVGQTGNELEIRGLADWCGAQGALNRPLKADQDRLDAAICVVVTYIWWRFGYERSLLVGDLETGYIVTPTDPDMAARIAAPALARGIPIHFDTTGAV